MANKRMQGTAYADPDPVVAEKMKYKSPVFVLADEEGTTVISKTEDNRIDEIITGIIVSALVFPLLLASIFFGLWIIFLAIIGDAPLLIIVMGVMFSLGGFGLFKLFYGALISFFPFKWKIIKLNETWELKRYVAGIRTFKKLCKLWSVECMPSYSRGDWGYYFTICYEVRKIRMTPPSAFKRSKSAAKILAEQDIETLKSHFGVDCKLLKWD